MKCGAQRFVGRTNRADDSGNRTVGLSAWHSGHILKLTGGLSKWIMFEKAPMSFGQLRHLRLKCQCSPLNRNSIPKVNLTGAYASCYGFNGENKKFMRRGGKAYRHELRSIEIKENGNANHTSDNSGSNSGNAE
jgi:hypothetical protein